MQTKCNKKVKVYTQTMTDSSRIRQSWTEGSLCSIYSRSKRCWYNGIILKIFNDSEGEWLKVRYNETKCKHIQRNCKDIKPNRAQTCKQLNSKYFINRNYKNMSLNSYTESKEFYDKLLICGYLRMKIGLLTIKNITNLICKWYHTTMHIKDFNLTKILGTGSFGIVQLARHKQTKKEYAIKILDKQRIIEFKQEKNVQNEKKILNQLNNPFIISLLHSFEDSNCTFFIFELLQQGCEFFDLLKIYDRLNQTQCVFYASQIVLIFEYLHSKHIIYRDLKPENLMYTNDGFLKLIDFGFSKQVGQSTNYLTKTLCGTPDYLAPETILGRGHSFGVDWWALGVLIFEMFVGFTPFEDDNVMQMYTNIVQHNQESEEEILKYLDEDGKGSPDLGDIVSKLLTKNPRKRLGKNSKDGNVDDVKSHPFFDVIDWEKIYNKEYTNPPKLSPMYKPKSAYPFQPVEDMKYKKYLNINASGNDPLFLKI